MRVAAEQHTSHSGPHGKGEGGLPVSPRRGEQPFESGVENPVPPPAAGSVLGQHGVDRVAEDLQK